jgi:hypothetical protein
MDKFLVVDYLPKLNKKNINHLNSSIMSNETESSNFKKSPVIEKTGTSQIHC